MNPISNLLKRVVSGGGGGGGGATRDGALLTKFLSHTCSSSPITPNPIKPIHPIQLQSPKSLSTVSPSPPPSPPPPSSSSTTPSSSSSDSHPSSKMQRLDFVWKILLIGNFAIFGYILMNMESKDGGKKKDEGKKKGEVDHVGEAPKPQVHYVYMDVHLHDDREK